METRTDPVASGRKGKVRLSSPSGSSKKALSHWMSMLSCFGLLKRRPVSWQSAAARQRLFVNGLMRGTMEAANASFPARLRRGLRRSGHVVLTYLSPSRYLAIFSSGMDGN